MHPDGMHRQFKTVMLRDPIISIKMNGTATLAISLFLFVFFFQKTRAESLAENEPPGNPSSVLFNPRENLQPSNFMGRLQAATTSSNNLSDPSLTPKGKFPENDRPVKLSPTFVRLTDAENTAKLKGKLKPMLLESPLWNLVLHLPVVLLLIISIGVLYILWRKYIQKNIEFSHYQSSALHSKLECHQLFNAMQSVALQIRNGQPQEAYGKLMNMTIYIRRLLNHSDQYEYLFEQELAFSAEYLDYILQMDSGKFAYQIQSHTTEDVEIVKIPSFIIQPFLENSVKHGFLGKPGKAGFHIDIHYFFKKSYLIIQIEDNGCGLNHTKKKAPGESLGIQLVQRKLDAYFIRSWNSRKPFIKIRQKSAQHRDGQGTSVTLFLPIKY